MQRFGWFAFVVSCTLLMNTQRSPADDDPGAAAAVQPAAVIEPAAAVGEEEDAKQAGDAKRNLLAEMRSKYFQLEELRSAGQTDQANLVEGELKELRDRLQRLLPVQLAAVQPAIVATVAHSPGAHSPGKQQDKQSDESSNRRRKLMRQVVAKYQQFRKLKEDGKDAEAEAVAKELKELRKQLTTDGQSGHHRHGGSDQRSRDSRHHHDGTDKKADATTRQGPSPEVRAKFAELRKQMHAAREAGDEQKVAEIRKQFGALAAKSWGKRSGNIRTDKKADATARQGPSPEVRAKFAELRKQMHAAREAGDEQKVAEIRKQFGALAAKSWGKRDGRGKSDHHSRTEAILARFAKLHTQFQAAKKSGNKKEIQRVEGDFRATLARLISHHRTAAGAGQRRRSGDQVASARCNKYGSGSPCSKHRLQSKSQGKSDVAHRGNDRGCRYCQAKSSQAKLSQAKRCQAKSYLAKRGEHRGGQGHFRDGYGKSSDFHGRVVDLRKKIHAATQSGSSEHFDEARRICRAAFVKAMAAHRDKQHGSFRGSGNSSFVCRNCQAQFSRHTDRPFYGGHRSHGGDSRSWQDRYADFARRAHWSHGNRDWYARGRDYHRPYGDRSRGSIQSRPSFAGLTIRASDGTRQDRSDDLQQLRQQVRRLTAQMQQVSQRLDRLAQDQRKKK